MSATVGTGRSGSAGPAGTPSVEPAGPDTADGAGTPSAPAHADGAAEGPAPDIPGEAVPEPLGTPLEPTGHPAVDSLVERLREVDRLVVTAHPAVYEDVHRGLDGILAALDRPAGPRPPGAPTDTGS
ncbi:hypothetical protein [Streptomyces sp. ST2-7A]|uniref:hypothetical protein n=1 Tax=Streptomyces sp. ST2-7A TaxID=2907214 RepID=UPI001F3803B1|nr:hypothetical protein [Streptomyces sp. ST2-7A]MCE7080817.1 hypothetical protein [Streptomyces sp. ST2-7A]